MLSSTAMAPGSKGGGVRGYLEMGILKDEEAREDYYLEGGTAKTEFFGGAMKRLGITSEYRQEDFERLFSGSAKDGTPLTQGKAESRVPGWDLTFSAPKSVSAIWAVAETDLQQKIESLHDEAVRETLGYLQKHIPVVNVGRGERLTEGKFSVRTETGKIAAALFRHGTSRAQDPDLHTHSLLFNVALRADGKLLSLNSTETFDRIKELGAIYRVSLASKLQDLGFGVEHDKQSFRVFGVSADLVNHWSTRRQQIEEKLNDSGQSGSKAATLANLATREDKTFVPTDELKSDWQKEGLSHHFDQAHIQSLRQQDYTECQDQFKNIVLPGAPDFSDMLSKMTEFESAVEPKKAREIVIQALQGRLTVPETEQYVDRFFSHQNTDLLHLTHEGKEYVTAREIYDIEFENKEIGLALHHSSHRKVGDRAFDKGMRKFVKRNGFELSDEQLNAVKHITQSTGALALVEGSAGAGKSTALEAAMYIWQKQGLSVRGAAPQGTAATNLQKETGMPATTVHKLLLDNQPYIARNGMRKSAFKPITKNDVIVIDESGTLDSRTMNRIENAVQAAGAKLVLVGDTAQTQPVPAGGASNALKQELPFATLEENRRQKNDLTLSTVTDVKSKNPLQALSRLLEHKKLTLPEDGQSAIKHTVDHWHNHISQASLDRSIMITNTNAEVKALNDLARQRLLDQGKIAIHTQASIPITDKDGSDLGSRPFAEGDLILFRKNHGRMGVSNGLRAVIKDISPSKRGGFDIVSQDLGGKSETHRLIRFNTSDYSTFNYGYAVTTNGAQSISIDHASILVGRGVENYHAAYVQVSRVKHDIHLTIPKSAEVQNVLDGPPTKNMISYAQDITKKNGLPEQDFTDQSFKTVRNFLNKYAKESMTSEQKQDHGPLEAVSHIIKSMKREQVKKTTLEFSLSSGLPKASGAQHDRLPKSAIKPDHSTLNTDDSAQKGRSHPQQKNDSLTKTPLQIQKHANPGRIFWDREQVTDLLMRNPGSIIAELVDERWNASHSKPRRIDAWGKNGSIKLNIDENHLHYGKVSDFERGYHGDLIGYVAFMTGKDWYSALDELAKNLNLKEGEQKNLGLTDAEKQQLKAQREKNRLKVQNQEKTERDTKIKRAQRIWSKSLPLEDTLAQRYLNEVRGVNASLKTADIRFLANAKEVYENEQGERLISYKPALIVAARDAEGVITSIQQIYLDPNTAHKHPEAKVAKRTIGPVKGSAVLMHEGGSNEVILTEGPETGASVAQGKPEANVYTSLGNNRNYGELAHLAKKHNTDTLIFAADNDGGFGKTYQSLEAAAEQLHKAGIKVKVAMPPLLPGQEKTDFNDVLLAKGAEEVTWKINNAEALKVENELSRDRSMSR